MDDDTRQQRQAVWTRHWATGAAHSCAGTYADTYGGAIADFWRGVHADTAPGARVLDIATGNAALPRLLLQLRPELDLHIDAVDLSHTQPTWLHGGPAASPARVQFHGGIRAEELPFAEGRFDLIVSQYGLEYADRPAALADVLRVRAPGGRMALLMHHAQSRPVTLAAVEIDHIDWLRGPQGLLTAARRMLAPMALAATAAGRLRLQRDPDANATRDAFNAAQDLLRMRSSGDGLNKGTDGADVLGEVQDAVAQLLPLAAQRGAAVAQSAWQQVDQSLADARWRLQELREAALDAADVEQLCAALQAAGLQTRSSLLHEQGHLMGWALRAA